MCHFKRNSMGRSPAPCCSEGKKLFYYCSSGVSTKTATTAGDGRCWFLTERRLLILRVVSLEKWGFTWTAMSYPSHESNKKGNNSFTVKEDENHLQNLSVVSGHLLLIWASNLEYCEEFAEVYPVLRLLLFASCSCEYQRCY